ncbi:uncharacterized protein LOC128986220 isoform X2 [Macrosteles quadrilineatus]|uniref:uncharacterized protein LOC128986220 isoform X2 n=1 Tax=Macrosteles quadrilineatus TaxID=74068 RepID=UPI0023E34CA5|nr:uncharacterized protein LOC128986220 isoform X2 [Macrosteles quadrilineatus]
MTKKKEIERLIARYRADIAALEEREEHFMRRIEILQNILPTVLVWYMWKVSQSSRERPFLQHETEERARSKLEHLQSMLLELQQADQLLKEEEDLMRHRIDELEKSLTFPRNSSRMIHSETTGILDAQKDKVDKLDYHNLASNVLQPAKDIDWKTVSEDLTKEAGELRDKLNNSLQKLQQSEDNANNLEKKSLTLVKELEGNVKLLETQKGKPTPTLKVVENEETTFQDKYDGKSLSSLQEDPAFEKQMRQSESKSLTHNEDNSMGPLAEVSHVQDLTSLLSNSSKEGKTHEMDNQPLKTPASIFNEPVSVELKVKDMSLNNLSTTMEPQQSPKESSVLDKLSISSTAKPQSPNTWPSTDGNKPSNGTVIGSLVSKNSISNKSEPEMPMLVSPAVVEGSSVSKVVMDTAEDHFPDALAITSENILESGKNEISKLEQKVSTHLESLHPAEESVLKLDVIRRINSEDVPQLTLVTDPHSKSTTSPEIQEATSKIDVVKQPTLNISRETLSETSQIADIEVGIDKRKSVSGTEGEMLSSFKKESVSSPTENKLSTPEKPPISGVSHDVTRSVSKEFPSRGESSLAELEDSPDINPTSHVLSNTQIPVISPSRTNIKDTISESASDQAHDSKVVMDTAEDHFPDALAITSGNILESGKNEISKLEQKVSTHLESLHPAEESVLKLDVIRRINSEDVPQLTLVTDPHSKSSTSPEIQEATSKIDVVKQPTLNISRETLSETSQIADIEVGIDKRKSVSGTEGEILSSFTKESVSSPTENKLPHPEKPPISGVSHDVTRSVSKEFPSRDESSLAELEDSPDINPTSHVLSNTKFPVISPSRKNIKDTISESASDQAHVSKVWNASENPNTSNDLVASPHRALSSFDPLILNETPSQQEATQSFHDVSQTPPEPVTGMSKDSMPSPSQETVKTTRVAANDNFMVRKPSITPANLPNLVESQNDDVVISPNPSDSEEVMSGLNIKKLSISETPITKVFKEVSKEKVLPKSSSNLKQISFGLDKGVTEGGREALLSETGVSKEVLPKEKANILVNEMQQSSSNRSGESEKKPKVDLILTKHKITDKVEPIESHLVGSTTSGNGKSPVFPVIQATKTVSEQSLVPGNDGILPETSEDKSQFKESIDHPTTEAEKTSLNLSGSSTLPMQTKIIQECPNKELSKEEFSSSPLLVPASHSKNLLSPFQDTSHFKGMDLDKVDVEPKVTIKPLESIQFVPLKSAADRTEGQAIVSEPMEAASTGTISCW